MEAKLNLLLISVVNNFMDILAFVGLFILNVNGYLPYLSVFFICTYYGVKIYYFIKNEKKKNIDELNKNKNGDTNKDSN